MDSPFKDELNKQDPKTLAAQLMAKEWSPDTTAKFKVLDAYKKSEELKKELLTENLDACYNLALFDKAVEEEKFTSAKVDYFNPPQVTIANLQELSIYKLANPAKSISANNGGQFICSDTSNKHFIKKTDGKIHYFVTTGRQIESVTMYDIENMVRLSSAIEIQSLNAVTGEQDSRMTFDNPPKKIFFSPRGDWFLSQTHSNKSGLCRSISGQGWALANIRNPTCIAIDELGQNALIGTTHDLFALKIENMQCNDKPVDKKPIIDIESVDVTPDGRFGLAVNNLGFCRIALQEVELPRIGECDDTVTIGRITNCGQFLLTGHLNGSVLLHKVEGETINKKVDFFYLRNRGSITCLALSPDNKTIAAGSMQGFFVANCRETYDEMSKASAPGLVTLLHTFNNDYSTIPLAIKETFLALKNAAKLQVLQAKKIDDDDLLCPICSERIIETLTSCNHEFCVNCLSNWKKNKNTCPTCRASLSVEKNNP